MATGDQLDMFARLKANLVTWFGATPNAPGTSFNPTSTPILDALTQGLASIEALNYDNIQYAQSQTRLNAAGVANVPQMSGIYLDLFSKDFFGDKLPRYASETDDSFRSRIAANLIQERATKKGMVLALTALTGIPPAVIEGFNAEDVGFYDTYGTSYGNQTFCYDQGPGYGFSDPYVGIVIAFLPSTTEPFRAIGSYDQITTPGDDYGAFGYDFNFNNAYIDFADQITNVTINDVLNVIQNTKCFGTFIYYAIFEGNTVVSSNFLPVP